MTAKKSAILYIAAIQLAIAACSKDSSPSDSSNVDPSPGGSGGGGSLKILPIDGALALGLVENDSSINSDQKVFATVKNDATTQKNDLTSLGFSPESRIESLSRLDPETLIVRGDLHLAVFTSNSLADTKTGAETTASIISISRDGIIEMLPPEIPKNAIVGSDGKLWFNEQGTVKYWDSRSKTVVSVTDDQLVVSEFLATSDGALFISGSVKTTGASFSRIIINSGSGFQIAEFKPTNIFSGIAYSPVSMSTLQFNSPTSFPSAAIFEVLSNQVFYYFAPWDIQSGLEKIPITANQATNSFSALFRPTSLSGSARKLSKVTLPLNESNLRVDQLQNFDRSNGIYFDGLNLVQLENNQGATTVKLYKTIKYNKALGFYAVKLFGPTNGFTSQGLALIVSQTNPSSYYLAPLSPTTGIIDVGSRYQLADSAGAVLQNIDPLAFQAAKAADKIFVQSGATKGEMGDVNLLSRKAIVSQRANLTLLEGSVEFRALNNIVVVGNYIVVNGGHVRVYDAGTDTQTLVGYCGSTNNGFAIDVVTLVVSQDASKAGFLCSNGTFIESTNWRQGLTSPVTISSGLDFYVGSGTKVFFDKNGKIIDSSGKIIVDSSGIPPQSPGLGGFNEGGTKSKYFGEDFSSIEVATHINGDLVFMSGISQSEYRSAVFNSATGVVSPITQLEGVQVYVAKMAGQRLLVNGLEIASNSKISKLFNPADFDDYIEIKDLLRFLQIESL